MSDEFENSLNFVAEAEKKYQDAMKRVEQNLLSIDIDKFNSTLLQSMEEMESVERKQFQAPLDTAAALKQIIQMIEDDRTEHEATAKKVAEQNRKQKRIETIRFVITTIIGTVAAVAAILSVVCPI